MKWMCRTAVENIGTWPEDKLSRWLGFIQGVLTLRSVIQVTEERDLSRALFRTAYKNAGIPIPDTIARCLNKPCV